MTARQPINPALDAARNLQQRGFAVFALAPNSKIPKAGTQGCKDASVDAKHLEEMFADPASNVGIALGAFKDGLDVVAIDLDRKNGVDGVSELQRLAGEAGAAIPDTLTSETPSGGRHLFFSNWSGEPLTNSAGKVAPGIDVRAAGGYVVGPGSTLNGGTYRFVNPAARVAPIPDWLLKRIRRAKPVPSKVKTEALPVNAENANRRAVEFLKGLEPASQGTRDDSAYKAAARIRDFGVRRDDAQDLMAEHFQCSPPLEPSELAHAVDSAFKYARGVQGAEAPEAQFPVVANQEGRAEAKARILRREGYHDFATQTFPDALVDELLDKGDLAVVRGGYGTLKSTFVMDLADSVSTGTRFYGRDVEKGGVLYIAAEDPEGIRRRKLAVRKYRKRESESVPFVVLSGSIDIRRAPIRDEIVAEAEAMKNEFGVPVQLIIFDTLALSAPGLEENSAADVGAVVSAAHALRLKTGATVLLVHHEGKDATKGARGSSALPAAVSTELRVQREGQLVTVTSTKQRNHSDVHAPIRATAKVIEIGKTTKGKPVTAVVLVPAEANAEFPQIPVKPESLAGRALAVLADMTDLRGVASVTRTTWRDEFTRRQYPGGKANTAWRAFERAVQTLENANRLEWRADDHVAPL